MRSPPYQQRQHDQQRGLQVAVEVGGHELQIMLEVAGGLAQGYLYGDDGQLILCAARVFFVALPGSHHPLAPTPHR
jgi:hypothetical protein